MECLSPLSIRDPKGTHVSQRISVPCGKCLACLANRRSAWTFRLKQELKVATSAHFITLTYNDENLPINEYENPTVKKKDVQDFFKRFRKFIHPFKIRYFLVSEYGSTTQRPHYHIILFNFPEDIELDTALNKTWKLGHHHIGNVKDASIHYVTKYCLAFNEEVVNRDRCFMLCSRKPAIGSNYLTSAMKSYHANAIRPFVVNNGFKQAMPKYYKDRLYTSDADKLAIRRLTDDKRSLTEKYYDSLYAKQDSSLLDSGNATIKTQQKREFDRRSRAEFKKSSKL